MHLERDPFEGVGERVGERGKTGDRLSQRCVTGVSRKIQYFVYYTQKTNFKRKLTVSVNHHLHLKSNS